MKNLLFIFLLLIASEAHAQVFVQIGNGSDTSTASLYSPLMRLSGTMGNRYCRSNFVLNQNELIAAGLPQGAVITAIAFNKTNITAYTGYSFYHGLYLTNSTISPPLSTLTSWASVLATHTKVYTDSNQTMPNNSGWITFNFNTPILYTGQNLSIASEQDWSVNQRGYNAAVATNWQLTAGYEDHIVGAFSVLEPPNLSGTTATYKRRPNIRVYYSLPTGTDAALLNFITPSSPVFGGTQQAVTLTVANAASNAITALTLNYQLNSGTVITENWIGNIQTGTSSTVTFNTLLATPAANTFNLKAWISSVNGAGLDLVRQNDSLNGTFCTVLNNSNYTVGGPGADFSNLQVAFDQIHCGGITGNVNLSLMQSDTGSFSLNNYPATPGSSLTITAGALVTLANAGTSPVLSLVQASNVTISNIIFERTAAPVAAQDLLFISNATDISVINNTFKGFAGSTSANNRLLQVSGLNTTLIQSNTFLNGYYGIHTTAGNSGNVNLTILNNSITNSYLNPINITGANNNTFISNNLINNNITVSSTATGIHLATGTNAIISGNQITGNIGDYGIHLNNYTGDSLAPNQVINNIIAGNFANSLPNGIRLTSSGTGADADFALVAYNSILLRTATTSTSSNAAIYFTGGTVASPSCNGIKFFNNVIQVISTATSGNLPTNYRTFYISNEYYLNNVLESNFNHFEVPNATSFAVQVTPAATFASIAAWRTTTGRDLNSQTGDPLFTDGPGNNLNPLIASPLNNAATPLNQVSADIIGNIRSTTNPDIGAYEIQNIVNSIVALSLDSPVNNLIPYTNRLVEARFLNAGSNTVNSLQLNYKYGNNPIVTENWTGILASGATLTYSFSTLMAVGQPLGIQPFVVWSALPNGLPDADPSNDSLLVNLCLPLPSGNYTVGSPSSNFTTISALTTSLNCAGISGPVTFNFEFPGNLYTAGNLIINTVPGVSSVNTITLNGQGDTIRHMALTGEFDRPIIGITNTDYVTVRDFVLQTSSSSFGHGVYLKNSNDIKICKNVIDLRYATGNNPYQFTGILASATHSGTFATNFNRLIVDSNYVLGAGHGILLFGDPTSFSVNLKISNNSFIDFYNSGVHLTNVDSAIVENNEISRPTLSFVSTFQGVNLENNTQGIIVRNNRIHNTHGGTISNTSDAYGVRIWNNANLNKRNQVYNNLIYNFQTFGSQNGILLSNADNVDLYFNTISLADVNAPSGLARGIYLQAWCRNINILNNNIAVTKGGTGAKHGIYLERDTTTFTSNRNNIYVNSAAGLQSLVYFGTTNYTTLAAWQAAASSLYDQNSISQAPNFTNLSQGNLSPQNLLLNNIALPIAGISTDFNGLTRGATPDIGAIEFSPLGIDLDLTTFLSNPGNGCIPNLSVPVTIRVENIGINPVTNVPVYYKLNSNAVVSNTIATAIVGGTYVDFTFPNPMIVRNGLDTLIIWIGHSGDQNPSNDSLFFFFNNYQTPPLSVFAPIDFEDGLIPAIFCTNIGDSAAIAVLGNVGSNTPLNGNFSLMMKGSLTGNPWTLPSLTNWWLLNQNHLSSIDFYVKADTVRRLQMAFNLRQTYAGIFQTSSFRVLIDGIERIAQGQTNATIRPTGSGSLLTVPLIYDLTSDVGDTIKITFQASVRFNELNVTPNFVLIDDIVFSQPITIGFDSITAIASICDPLPHTISTVLDTLLPITTVQLNYNVNGGIAQNIAMSRAGTSTWTTILAAQAVNATVNYRIIATDTSGNSDTSDYLSFVESPITINAGVDQSIIVGTNATLFATTSGLYNAVPHSLPTLANGGSNLLNGAVSMNIQALETVLLDTITTRIIGPSIGAIANVSIWYKTTPINGGPLSVESPEWILHATNIMVPTVGVSSSPTTPMATFIIPALTIPAGATYGIVVAVTGVTLSVWLGVTTYSIFNPNLFNDGRIIIDNGPTAGFGGTLPSIGAIARQFNGRIGYRTSGPVHWSIAGNPAVIANSDTIVVTPAATTTYIASVSHDNCSKTDTVVVNVVPLNDPDLIISRIISPGTGPTYINSPLTITYVVTNIGTQPAIGYSLLATANGTPIANQAESVTLQSGDSVTINMNQLWDPNSGTYNVCVSVNNTNDPILANNELCVNNVQIANTTSLFDSELNDKLIQKAYPNPASAHITLAIAGCMGSIQLYVADITGKIIRQDVIESNNTEITYELDVHSLAEGLYHFRLVDASGQQATLRFVVSR